MEPRTWYLAAGVVLCAMAIGATLIRRLPLSTAMLYLPLGWALGPHGANAIHIDIANDAVVVEQITKAIILISLFSAGLKMRLPITSRLWFLSLRLAFLSMLVTVGLIAFAGVFLFGLPTGVAILMGGILAPTDPVLAADVQVDNPYQLGALRFGLTSEAGLNDGSAFPFVLLGLMLLMKPIFGTGLPSIFVGEHWRDLRLGSPWQHWSASTCFIFALSIAPPLGLAFSLHQGSSRLAMLSVNWCMGMAFSQFSLAPSRCAGSR